MKVGFRKPNIKSMVKARTTGRTAQAAGSTTVAREEPTCLIHLLLTAGIGNVIYLVYKAIAANASAHQTAGTGSYSVGGQTFSETWTMGPVEGYDAGIHDAMPYDFTSAPQRHMWTFEHGQVVNRSTTAHIVGANVEQLRRHVMELQRFVEQARSLAPELHSGFVLEAGKIPDASAFPPVCANDLESPSPLATFELTPRTETGRVPKFPLTVHFDIDGATVLRDGVYFRQVPSPKADETLGQVSYLADGTIGKASLHLWRKHLRWTIDLVTIKGSLGIARIERQSLSEDQAQRFYDYKA